MPDTPERPPISQSPLSVVLLAFNAAPDLEEVVTAWDTYLADMSRRYEILLVNDGSTDDTGPRADQLAAQKPHLRVLHDERHSGVGAALRTGIREASHPLVLTVPCDKQFQPPDLYRIFEAIDQVDLVVGYRVGLPVPLVPRIWDFMRLLLARVFLGAPLEPRSSWPGWAGWRRRWLARWLFGVRVQDPECLLRLYRRTIFERLPLQSDSSVAQLEILAKANHLECIMAEVPVSWLPPRNLPPDPIEKQAGRELRRLFFEPTFEKVQVPDTQRNDGITAPP
jgi:glycosyltransferase involved in cell wall biosynthesis